MIGSRDFVSKLMFLSLFVAVFKVFASDCGVLRLQTARSAGVEVVSNTCKDVESLAVKSIVHLGTDSRAWFESIPDASGVARFQIVCQNLSSSPVTIKLANPFLPWLQPDKRLDCGAWTRDRLECKESGSHRTGLICAIALKKIFVATHEIQRNTSVIMRSKDKSANSRIQDGQEAKQLESIIDKEINPKLKLCEGLFTRNVIISWTIKAGGQVANTAVMEDAGDDEFTLCALKAVESYVFPAYSNDIQVQTTFK